MTHAPRTAAHALILLIATGLQAAPKTDTLPPELTLFSLPETAQAGGPLVFQVEVKDDASGVRSLSGSLLGPDGQSHDFGQLLSWPQKRHRGPMGLTLSKWLVPGEYRFTRFELTDASGRATGYDAAQLEALGSNRVQVQNPAVPDNTAPVLIKGEVLTPVISISDHAPGTRQMPYARVRLRLLDPMGALGRSGIARAEVELGEAGWYYWSYRIAAEVSTTGQGELWLETGGQLGDNYSPPVPQILDVFAVYLIDHAGNSTKLLNRFSGGQADFDALFPKGSRITLVP